MDSIFARRFLGVADLLISLGLAPQGWALRPQIASP